MVALGVISIVIILIIILIVWVYLIANAWTMYKIYVDDADLTTVSRSTAGWYFALSAFFAIVLLGLLIYLTYALITARKTTTVAATLDTTINSCSSGICSERNGLTNFYQYS